MESLDLCTTKRDKCMDVDLEDENKADENKKPPALEFGVEDNPPWYLSIFLGVQVSEKITILTH